MPGMARKSAVAEDEDVEVEATDAPIVFATRNPPVNINVNTGNAANTAGAVNVKPTGGADLPSPGAANQIPNGGANTWESGTGTAAPTLTTIAPTTFALASAPTNIVCTGTGFLPTSVVVLNGVALETTYQSATQVTGVAAASGQAVGTVQATVNNGPTATGTKPFIWT